MSLSEMKRALTAEVRAKKNQTRFEEAKKHQPELHDHDSASSVLTALRDDSALSHADKEALVRALIREQQQRPHPLWNAVLGVAFYPMLLHIRYRVHAGVLPCDEIDQSILATFLEAVSCFPLAARTDGTCAYLRLATQRRIIGMVSRARRGQERHPPTDPQEVSLLQDELWALGQGEQWPDLRSSYPHRYNELDAAEAVQFLWQRAGRVLKGDRFELLVATLIRGEMLSDYVRRVYPELTPAEYCRVYERVKRRHSRAMGRVRELVASEMRAARHLRVSPK